MESQRPGLVIHRHNPLNNYRGCDNALQPLLPPVALGLSNIKPLRVLTNVTPRWRWTRVIVQPGSEVFLLLSDLVFLETCPLRKSVPSPQKSCDVCGGRRSPNLILPTSFLPLPSPAAGSRKLLPHSFPLDARKTRKYPAVLETLSARAEGFKWHGHVPEGYHMAQGPTPLRHCRAHS